MRWEAIGEPNEADSWPDCSCDCPENPYTVKRVEKRLEAERGSVVRVF